MNGLTCLGAIIIAGALAWLAFLLTKESTHETDRISGDDR